MSDLKPLLAKVADGKSLSREEARTAFNVLMSGEATPSQIAGLLMALRVRGETVDEITGAVEIMREKMLPVDAPADAIDIVGTGGDASGSYNISTCAAFVAAGAGLTVAKHGNRALSSKSGSADVLMALGVKLDTGPEKISACIREAGLGFMFAPQHHSSMKHVGPTRVELGTRTMPFGRELWIEGEDFQEVPEKGFRRLFPGNKARLKYGYIVECTGCDKDEKGKVIAVHCNYLPETKSGTPGADTYKVKGNIHWLSATDALPVQVRLYDRLFSEPNPDAGGRDYKSVLNPNALKVIQAYVEPGMAAAQPDDRVQFERHG